MKNIVLLHIPHSSLKFTKEFKVKKKHISPSEIKEFNNTITDLFTDQLFSSRKFYSVKAKYSRICCDMEKFADDSKEEMAKYGMGVVYTNTNKNKKLISVSAEYRQKILKKYYYPYHNNLDKVVSNFLAKNKYVVMVDCHSFSKNIIMNGKTENLPDICIGSNESGVNDLKLLHFTKAYFENLGYKTSVNYPYSNSMVPNNLIKHPNEKFASIMLEINKSLYLKGLKKSKNFAKLKKDIFNYLCTLKTICFE